MDSIQLNLADIVENDLCVASTQGTQVGRLIREHFDAGDHVMLSFEGVSLLTAAFLNTAIGELYGQFPEDFIREHISVKEDTAQDDLQLLKYVVDHAKLYYRDPERAHRV